jgi:hypothetical protein|tara:strand:- start:538 stop:795 length:258 start_codon:yes stop_codon:yes gene_type:complete
MLAIKVVVIPGRGGGVQGFTPTTDGCHPVGQGAPPGGAIGNILVTGEPPIQLSQETDGSGQGFEGPPLLGICNQPGGQLPFGVIN